MALVARAKGKHVNRVRGAGWGVTRAGVPTSLNELVVKCTDSEPAVALLAAALQRPAGGFGEPSGPPRRFTNLPHKPLPATPSRIRLSNPRVAPIRKRPRPV